MQLNSLLISTLDSFGAFETVSDDSFVGQDSALYSKDKGEHYIKNTLFDVDVHYTFVPSGKYIITDTYPDRDNNQRLIVYKKTKKHLVLAVFNAYYTTNPASCDLYTKLSKDGNYVVVASAHGDKHYMLVFNLDWKLIENRIS